MEWTSDQKNVITLRNKSILVSAAAGSGKTAVLVQRIMQKLTDPVAPVSVDRLLIMTFTRAAAGEMKERLQRAIEKALAADPGNDHLQKQLMLLHMAQITTIDGFCGWILRNYFHLIGLDPGYRVADEGELVLLKQDTARKVMDEFHDENDPEFRHMLDSLCTGRTDESLQKEILRVYEKAMSSPDPEGWLDECLKGFDAGNAEEMAGLPWMELLWKTVSSELSGLRENMEYARGLCLSPDGPYHFEDGINDGLEYIRTLCRLCGARNYDGMVSFLADNKFPELSRKRPKGIDDDLKQAVSSMRNETRAEVDDLRKSYFLTDLEETAGLLKISRRPVEMLLKVVRRYMERFSQEKREKNILDFTDMEHMALRILSPGEGETGGSVAARELSEKFDEVMIDEYQDSNMVQELIARYVSGWVQKRHNIFMVGDVRQSIYRFRLARPDLFIGKYRSFSKEDGDDVKEIRVDLGRNFRSRPEVLTAVNYIFRQIMGSDLGGIDYGEDESLHPGAVFPEGQEPSFPVTELLLIKKDDPLVQDEEEARTERELEAMLVAERIRGLVGKQVIYDRDEGGYRPVRYGDIAVLLRSFTGWAETFLEVFASRGIPAYAASRSGYFSASEVVNVLNFLRITDNPRQDIPLLGVLKSPMVSCTDEELALLRVKYKDGMLIDSIYAFIADEDSGALKKQAEDLSDLRMTGLADENDENGDPGEEQMEGASPLRKKLADFCALLEHFREAAVFTPVHQLIRDILRDTGYGMLLRAMPDGAKKSANVMMLCEKALEYEKTSYHGLFHFIRYIENLHKYEVDFGEVSLSGEGEGAVRLMTIHKSKGLEFPIVFVSGLGKGFNFMDANEPLLVDADLGIATDAILPERSLRVPFLKRRITRDHIVAENNGEELRVLYVALTRAVEKLIMTGSIGNFDKKIEKLRSISGRERELLPLTERQKARSFLDFILPALAGHRCMDSVFASQGIFPGKNPLLHDDPSEFDVRICDIKELIKDEASSLVRDIYALQYLRETDPEQTVSPEIREELEKRFSYVYPYTKLSGIPVKMTVSELKKRSYHDDEELEYSKEEEPVIPLIPDFLQGEKEELLTGSSRGTAYHRVMECLDYSRDIASDEDVRAQIEGLVIEKKLGVKEAECIIAEDIVTFAASDLGRRMAEAAGKGVLKREQPFMMQVPALSIDPSWEAGENVLIQGIIDAYFFEDEDIVLVDYKTDRVYGSRGAEKLVSLYHTQLSDYAAALERLTGRRVKEKYIWSFTLGREILLR